MDRFRGNAHWIDDCRPRSAFGTLASVGPTDARMPVERRWPADACGSPPQGEETSHPLSLLSGLAPSVPRLHEHDAEVDRRAAALRTVEPVRLHAAAHGGRMPASLDAVDIVPVPLDPMTGKPFQCDSDGHTATLVREGLSPLRLKVVYRIAPRG
jgi:hypothetical protein